VGLAQREMLVPQLRAVLRAGAHGPVKVMAPMIARVDELRSVRAAMEAEAANLGLPMVPLGVMVETPAAAVMADALAAECDFLSIGTNDLTQYALAMDRGNPAVAGSIDGLDPAVLRLIGLCCEGAESHGKWVGVCGGLASDPLAVPILIGLGVTELSAAPAMVPEIKALVRALSSQDCRALALEVLQVSTAAQVRVLATQMIEGGAGEQRAATSAKPGPRADAAHRRAAGGGAAAAAGPARPARARFRQRGGQCHVRQPGPAVRDRRGHRLCQGWQWRRAAGRGGLLPGRNRRGQGPAACRQTLPPACRRRRWPPSRPPGAAHRSIMSQCHSALSQGSSGASATIASRGQAAGISRLLRGRRFVPIISGLAGVALAGLLGASLGSINAGANAASQAAWPAVAWACSSSACSTACCW
jgi:hypothetical protein